MNFSQAWGENLLTRVPQHPVQTGAKSPGVALGPRTKHPILGSALPAPHFLGSAPSPLTCSCVRPPPASPARGRERLPQRGTPPTPRGGCRNPAGLRGAALPLAGRTAIHFLPPPPLGSQNSYLSPGLGAAGFYMLQFEFRCPTSTSNLGRGSLSLTPPTGSVQGSPEPRLLQAKPASYQRSWNCHCSAVTPEVSVRECHLGRAGREPAVGRRLGVRQACSVL